MKKVWFVYVVATVTFLSGCSSVRMKQLTDKNETLSSQVSERDTRIQELKTQKHAVEEALVSQKGIGLVLAREKADRTAGAAATRKETRAFVRQQMEILRLFADSRALLDYVGSEVIPRKNVTGSNLLLLNLQDRVPSTGILVGGKVLVNGATKVSFCVLRPRGKAWVVLWVSDLLAVTQAGVSDLTFSTHVAVQKGDLIGLYSPAAVQVPCSRGTGGTRTVKGPIRVGQVVSADAVTGSDRAYSFAAAGFLE